MHTQEKNLSNATTVKNTSTQVFNLYQNLPIICFTEVARTRLREAGTKYRSFWQTLVVVYREEGRRGLYRGLGTQLVRQIPNTAIMMATYELTVYMLRQTFYTS